ncbi:MAG: hypothetical protein ACI9VL_001633 [Colwellia sp.]
MIFSINLLNSLLSYKSEKCILTFLKILATLDSRLYQNKLDEAKLVSLEL